MNELITVKQLDESLIKTKELKQKIDFLWKNCDDNTMDCDEVSFNVDSLEKEFYNNLSMYIAVKNLDNIYNRKDDEQYDVAKIKISEEDEKVYKEYDRKNLELFYTDWKKEKIDKEIGMLYLFNGFSINMDFKKNEFKLEEGFIIKKEKI